MPAFTYRAKDASGITVTGTVNADDSRAAAGKIRDMGYFPLDVKPQGKGQESEERTSSGFSLPWQRGTSVRSLAVFFRQLATMLQAGMALSESLDSLGRQRGMGRLPEIAAYGAEHVRSGRQFSDLLELHPHIFSRMQIGLVRAGETGGMLEGMIDRIAGYLERELALRRKFAGITFYPKLIAVFIILAVIFIPHVGEIVDRGWPVVFFLLRSRVLLVVVFLVMLWAGIKLLLALPPVRLVWDQVKISFPVLGSAMRKLAMSRFAMTLSVTYAAGIPLGQAVELSSDAMGNEVLRQSVLRSVPELRAGGQLSEAFKRTGGMPDLVLGMVATGERTGSLDTVLDKVSEYYNSEAEATIEKSGYLLFVLLILALGAVVGLYYIGFFTRHYGGLLRSAGG